MSQKLKFQMQSPRNKDSFTGSWYQKPCHY